jgi:hypothetical protein
MIDGFHALDGPPGTRGSIVSMRRIGGIDLLGFLPAVSISSMQAPPEREAAYS